MKIVGNPIKLTSTSQQTFSPPPLLGEHTEEVLSSIGYPKEMIEKLIEKKVV